MSKEDYLKELRSQLEAGSLTQDVLVELVADLSCERDKLKLAVEEEKKNRDMWYENYVKCLDKESKMKESMLVLEGVTKEIIEKWK